MFVSDRDLVLITQTKDRENTIITFENYGKWYNTYLIKPNGNVEKFEPDYHTELGQKYYSNWGNHAIVPKIFVEVANELGFIYDRKTYNAVVNHFLYECLDDDVTKLTEYLPEK